MKLHLSVANTGTYNERQLSYQVVQRKGRVTLVFVIDDHMKSYILHIQLGTAHAIL